MRIYLLAFILLLLGACAKTPELNYENIKHLLIKLDPQVDMYDFAENYLKGADYSQYFELGNKPEKRKQLLDPTVRKLSNAAENNEETFVYRSVVYFMNYDESTEKLTLKPLFLTGIQQINSKQKSSGFPEVIALLYPNPQLTESFEVPTEKFSVFKQSRTENTFNELSRKSLYLEFRVKLFKAQNKRFFQAVITEAHLFDNPNKDQLLSSTVEPRNHLDLINNRLLSAGITLNMSPLHGFSFYGQNLLDPFIERRFKAGSCSKQGIIKSHQRIICEDTLYQTENGRLVMKFFVLGGLLEKIQLIRRGYFSEETIRAIKLKIDQDLKVGLPFLNQNNSSTWVQSGASFTFFNKAMTVNPDEVTEEVIFFEMVPIKIIKFLES
ncbi:MAG: hypothetical protein L3J52_00520 [Proteobacteria bacterium]|nr:hypothetical protein [Pseudomonadota bacterium]